jgi:hypothetical protein
MAARRHNLTRRALLGAGAVLPVLPGAARAAAEGIGARASGHGTDAAAVEEGVAAAARWARTLRAYRRAEARVAAFKAEEALLPPERREWPAVRVLEERFGDLDSLRLAALRRLFQIPAPDLAALSLKLDLAVADQAWELTGCESCFEAAAADARRLCRGG